MLIVAYHAIGTPASRVTVPAGQLQDDLSALMDAGYTFVSLDACAGWLAGDLGLPARAVAVTFDDGYASVATAALPVLERRRVPATVFVVGGRIGLNNQWPGQPRWVPTLQLLDAGMLRELVTAGVTIGSHSWTHSRLTALDQAQLDDEMIGAADRLEQIAGVAVRHLAYPYGSIDPAAIAKARSRFRTAVTAACRPVYRDSDPHMLGRLDAHDLYVAARLHLLGSIALTPYLGARRGLRALLR